MCFATKHTEFWCLQKLRSVDSAMVDCSHLFRHFGRQQSCSNLCCGSLFCLPLFVRIFKTQLCYYYNYKFIHDWLWKILYTQQTEMFKHELNKFLIRMKNVRNSFVVKQMFWWNKQWNSTIVAISHGRSTLLKTVIALLLISLSRIALEMTFYFLYAAPDALPWRVVMIIWMMAYLATCSIQHIG